MNNYKQYIIQQVLSTEQRKVTESPMDYYERLSKIAMKLDSVQITDEDAKSED